MVAPRQDVVELPRRLGVSIVTTGLLLAAHASAFAQTRDYPSVESDDTPERAVIKQLQKRLDQRDSEIRSLVQQTKRLERLYRQDHATLEKIEPVHASKVGRAATGPAPAAYADARPQTEQNQVGQNSSNASPPPTPPANGDTPPSENGGGQFRVSPEAAEHALERALVQTGAQLLKPGKFEFVPSETIQFNQVSKPDQVVLTSAGRLVATQDVQHSTLLETQALVRGGLPWGAQFELSTSFDYASLTTSNQIPGSFLSSSSTEGSGLGDTSVKVTKQIHEESDWVPSLFISGTGNIGQQNHGLALGSGYDWLRGGITAVKRQDPLVFTAGFSYQTNFPYHGLVPGDQYMPSVGMLFAVSPETSLQFNQQVTFVKDFKFRGATLPGSSQVEAAFQAGVLSILAPGIVVDLAAAVGETPDTPDLTIQLAFPIRLN